MIGIIRWLIAILLLAFGLSSLPAASPHLTANPGFAQLDDEGFPGAWTGWSDVWQADREVAYSGRCSARFQNTDPNRYLLLIYEGVAPSDPESLKRLEEMRCMTYLALTQGAGGLVYHSCFDLKRATNHETRREDVRRMISEVKRFFPIFFLSGVTLSPLKIVFLKKLVTL